MATTSSVGSTYMGTSYEEYQNELRVAKTQLGKNDFLNLLVAQLQHQDPLEPTKDSDFIAQLAQFSSLEQMENMSKSMAMMQAFDLVGKYVYATDVMMEDGSRRDVGGVVDSVIYKNGEYYALIGETYVNVSKITEVYDKSLVNPENQLTSSAHLLGSTVKSYITDEKGNLVYEKTTEPVLDKDGKETLDKDGNVVYKQGPAKVVTGVVSGIGMKDGVAVAYLKTDDGEITVPINLIFDIRQTATPAQTPAVDQPVVPPVKPEAHGTIITPEDTGPPETDPPETDPPETDPPETDPPVTNPGGGNGSIIITP